ncbi:MAG: hypothetical protein MI867_22655 [Pseudomonadales bacterium]|nr:hypothetical protein [Pseudomonadales bacterium]
MRFDRGKYLNLFSQKVSGCILAESNLLDIELPLNAKLSLGPEDIHLKANDQGLVNYLDDRLVEPDRLKLLSAKEAGELTFLDGKVPSWINLVFEGYDKDYSYIRCFYCRDLASSDEQLRPMPDGTKQFRILLSKKESLKKPK